MQPKSKSALRLLGWDLLSLWAKVQGISVKRLSLDITHSLLILFQLEVELENSASLTSKPNSASWGSVVFISLKINEIPFKFPERACYCTGRFPVQESDLRVIYSKSWYDCNSVKEVWRAHLWGPSPHHSFWGDRHLLSGKSALQDLAQASSLCKAFLGSPTQLETPSSRLVRSPWEHLEYPSRFRWRPFLSPTSLEPCKVSGT